MIGIYSLCRILLSLLNRRDGFQGRTRTGYRRTGETRRKKAFHTDSIPCAAALHQKHNAFQQTPVFIFSAINGSGIKIYVLPFVSWPLRGARSSPTVPGLSYRLQTLTGGIGDTQPTYFRSAADRRCGENHFNSGWYRHPCHFCSFFGAAFPTNCRRDHVSETTVIPRGGETG